MQHASLTNAAWNAEKNLLVAESDAALAPPLGRLYREVCRAASATPICATAPLGDRSDIVATSADDVRSAYRTYDVPSATTLVIAGDVRAADAFALAAAAFDPMVASPAPARPDAAPQFARDVQIRMRGSAPYDVFDVAYPAPGASDARAAAFALLDAALNDERSEMYRALVDGGYVAGFATRWDRDRRGGLYHVFVVVAHDHALETVRTAFLAAIARTRERGIPEDLVVAAKSSRIRAAEDAADSIDGIAERVGYAIAVEQSAGPGVEAERVRESTAEEVNAAARIYLATPAATGLLDAGNARDSGPPGAPPDSTNDDFSRRAPLGRSIEAPWIRTALALPETQASGLQPEAFVLPNGLRVLVQPVHANPTVFVSGIVETSPRFEPRAREGIGALASRSFAYDGAKYDAVARRRVAETLGASFDFGFAFAAHGRAGDLQAMLDVLADSLATPTFASNDVEAVRADLRERTRFPDPNEVAERDVERLLLRHNDPARRQPSDASLRAISLEDVRAFVRRFVRPDLTTLAVVGDVDPATVRAAVAATFGEWAAPGRTPDVRLPPFATARAARRRVPAGGERIEARFASPACARGSRDFYALAILERLLGNRIAPSATAELRSNRFRGLPEFRLTSTPATLAASGTRVTARDARIATRADRGRRAPSRGVEGGREHPGRRTGNERHRDAGTGNRARPVAARRRSEAARALRGRRARRHFARRPHLSPPRRLDRSRRRTTAMSTTNVSEHTIRTIDPSTGREIQSYAEHDDAAVDAALARAAATFRSWREQTFAERAPYLHAVAAQLRERKSDLARLATREMGKTLVEAEAEVEKCALCCDYYADEAATHLADRSAASNATESFVAFRPLGVLLAIMPWNFPYWQLFRAAAPALMAGNVVVLKHAANVSGCALEIENIFRAAGLPDGAFATLLVSGSRMEAIVADPRVAAVTLTGSEAAGSAVAATAGKNLKKTVLELGGSDAFIVLADADIEAAAKVAVKARFQNNGQSCIAAKRFIVEAPVYEAFLGAFVDNARALVIGDPASPETTLGPLARADLRDSLERQVAATLAAGATLALGGRRVERDGFYFEATILAGVAPGMPAFDEETFGPVAAVVAARDAGDAIELANASQYGLGGNLWTRDVARGKAFAARLESGAVFINGMTASDPRLPFGGVKQSGYGRELSGFGIQEFVNIQTVWIGPAKDAQRSVTPAE